MRVTGMGVELLLWIGSGGGTWSDGWARWGRVQEEGGLYGGKGRLMMEAQAH